MYFSKTDAADIVDFSEYEDLVKTKILGKYISKTITVSVDMLEVEKAAKKVSNLDTRLL